MPRHEKMTGHTVQGIAACSADARDGVGSRALAGAPWPAGRAPPGRVAGSCTTQAGRDEDLGAHGPWCIASRIREGWRCILASCTRDRERRGAGVVPSCRPRSGDEGVGHKGSAFSLFILGPSDQNLTCCSRPKL